MEFNVTDIIENHDTAEFSGSVYSSGLDNIGAVTWRRAHEYATESPLATTPDQLAAIADWVAEFGAWDEAEIEAMSDTDLNAMLVQSVAGDKNTSEHYDSFEEYSEKEGGRLYQCDIDGDKDFGQWFYYVGC